MDLEIILSEVTQIKTDIILYFESLIILNNSLHRIFQTHSHFDVDYWVFLVSFKVVHIFQENRLLGNLNVSAT